MLKNYFKIAFRNLWKHKLYTCLNVFGLSIGIACCMVLYQFISYHLSFDKYHHQADKMYRVVTDLHLADGSIEYDQGAPIALGERLKSDVSQITEYGLLLKNRSFTVATNPEVGNDKKNFSEHKNIAFSNQNWFQFFDYHWEAGNPKTALTQPLTAVITQRLTNKYFGQNDPIGKIIKLDNKHDVKITGVLENYPANTDFKVDMFLSAASVKYFYPDIEEKMKNNWGWVSSSTSLFVSLQEGTTKEQIDQEIKRLTEIHMGELASYYKFHLQPLEDIHFNSRYGGIIQKSLLIALGVIGLLLILIASFNFINLATAQSTKRAKEIGIRKALGNSSSGIFWQYITETACMTLLAFFLAVMWVNLFMPILNSWLKTDIIVRFFDTDFLIRSIVFLISIIFIAGFYPAVMLSRFKPINTLKGLVVKTQVALMPRKFLIVGQNVIAQVLIICTVVITMQVNFLKTADLGFSKEAVIMVPIPDQDKSKISYLRNQLKAKANISNVSFCFRAPSSDYIGGGSVKYNGQEWEDFVIRSRTGDVNFIETFNLKLIAGRNLQESDTVREFVVNEEFLQRLGIKDTDEVLGNTLVAGEFSGHEGTIVGVVKDFHASSLHREIEPLVITTKLANYEYAAIKVNPENTSSVINDIQSEWKAVFSDNVFEYQFLDDQIAQAYQHEELINKLIKFSAVIAIFLSCLGLFGLISLLTVQRTKEIGIRKVLGASISKIVLMLSNDFLKLLTISIIIAMPIAWYAMDQYLQNFSYRIEIKWWMFVLSGLAAVFIALLTISYQSIKAALANPVESLKNE